MSKLLSIVLPVFNEQENIPVVYQELVTALQKLPAYSHEIIFVDDGSSDASWLAINRIAKNDRQVKGVCFSRNFGHQVALTAGYDVARGDVIISLDADMQHPPHIIPDMVKKWEEGAHIVYARRIDRNDTFLKKITALLYYRLLNKIADIAMPRNVADFRLIDKQVLHILQRSKEHSRYLRGMIAWTGFSNAFVDFKCQDRRSGQSGYTWKKMLRLAFDGITGFSTFPLKIAALVGSFVVITGGLMLIFITCETFFFNAHYPLFKWLVTINYIFMGIQFFLMWLLGEYIGRIYDQLRDRPLYIIAQEINIQPASVISFQPNKHTEHQKEF
jgi:glycosyltransferase involved in cell wall biosynthesis